MKLRYLFISLTLLFLQNFSVQAKDPFDSFVRDELNRLDYNLSGPSLDRLRYIRYKVAEYIHDNRADVNVRNFKPELERLEFEIKMREDIGSCLHLKNTVEEFNHPIVGKFRGVDVYNPKKIKTLINEKSSKNEIAAAKIVENILEELTIYNIKPKNIDCQKNRFTELKDLNDLGCELARHELELYNKLTKVRKENEKSLNDTFNEIRKYYTCYKDKKDFHTTESICKVLGKIIRDGTLTYSQDEISTYKKDLATIVDKFSIIHFMKGKKLSSAHIANAISDYLTKPEFYDKKNHKDLFINYQELFKTDEERRMFLNYLDQLSKPQGITPVIYLDAVASLPDYYASWQRPIIGDYLATLNLEERNKVSLNIESGKGLLAFKGKCEEMNDVNYNRPLIEKTPSKLVRNKGKSGDLKKDQDLLRSQSLYEGEDSGESLTPTPSPTPVRRDRN